MTVGPLRTVSWSNYCHTTDAVNTVYENKTYHLPQKLCKQKDNHSKTKRFNQRCWYLSIWVYDFHFQDGFSFQGALAGGIVSMLFFGWLSFGQTFSDIPNLATQLKPAPTDMCQISSNSSRDALNHTISNVFISTTPTSCIVTEIPQFEP